MDTLKKMGYEPIILPSFHKLQKGVSSHADMLCFKLYETLLVHSEYYNLNRQIFDSLNVKIQTTDEYIAEDYPNDVLFNAVLTSENVLYARSDSVSKYIKDACSKIVSVKQGYTACSTCKVSDNAFITTDEGLYKTYKNNGIDCLLVGKKDIELKGYDCGFIGGASLVIDDLVCFFGDVSKHGDCKKIVDFISKHGKETISLSGEKMTDVGGCVVLDS